MSSLIDNEARGDWGGIKGAEYHLVYAIWLLLRGGSSQIAFYQGNDLLADAALYDAKGAGRNRVYCERFNLAGEVCVKLRSLMIINPECGIVARAKYFEYN